MYKNRTYFSSPSGSVLNISKFDINASLEILHELHRHDFFEICYIEAGHGKFIIDNCNYSILTGDIIITSNKDNHTVYYDDNCKIIVIQFDPDFVYINNEFHIEYLQPFLGKDNGFLNKIDGSCTISNEMIKVIIELEQEWSNNLVGHKLIIKGLLYKLLGLIYRHYKLSITLSEESNDILKAYFRIKDAINFIHSNLTEDLNLDDIAQSAFMHRTYFSSYFKKVMRINVFDYINKLRINMACELLSTTNKLITEISYECGFNSVQNFNKTFKAITGVAPNQFRSENTMIGNRKTT